MIPPSLPASIPLRLSVCVCVRGNLNTAGVLIIKPGSSHTHRAPSSTRLHTFYCTTDLSSQGCLASLSLSLSTQHQRFIHLRRSFLPQAIVFYGASQRTLDVARKGNVSDKQKPSGRETAIRPSGGDVPAPSPLPLEVSGVKRLLRGQRKSIPRSLGTDCLPVGQS